MRDEGILKFYNLTNTAPNGAKPIEKLVDLEVSGYYANRTIGVTRLYAAKGSNSRLDKLVWVYNTIVPEAAKYVILEDGRQYLIDAAVQIVDSDAVELSLVRLENYYEVAE
jgi:hypothetical protein